MGLSVESHSVFELRAQRLVVRGLTEREVRQIWGRPRARRVVRPEYVTCVYAAPEADLTVVFERGRVVRVEEIRDMERRDHRAGKKERGPKRGRGESEGHHDD